MKNLTGFLKKIPYLFSLLILLSFSKTVSAAENFQIYTTFEHTLTEQIINTEVVIQIRSETPRVLSYYTASIPVENIQTECINFKTNQKLDCTFYHRGSVTDVLLDLKNSVIRPDNPLEIKLKYSTTTVVGMAYTFSSKITDTTTNSIIIKYPKAMEEPLWTSDPIQNIKTSGENLEVTINKPTYSSISMLFGKSVTYRFEISKVFSNSSKDENQTFEVYVPSDTSNQIIIWDEISPLPNTTLQDGDGNYVFKYVVAPNETLDCKINGYIQKIDTETEEDVQQSFLTEKTGYWSITNNTEFKRVNSYLQKKGINIQDDFDNIDVLDSSQKELFYKYIYQYVIDRLNFESNITLGITNETRLGANSLTESSNNSSTSDYADFLIALLRAYNVPSRLIIGYISNVTGYTSDGFYHHWVEFFDSNTKRWVTVDPFLEEYFDKVLFGSTFHDHITILKRGMSAVAPKISFFNDNDFTIQSETEEEIEGLFDVSSQLSFENYKITDKFLKGYVYISNVGNTTINGYSITKSNISNIQQYLDPVNNLQSQIILPKQNSTLQFNIPNEMVATSNIFLNISFKNFGIYENEKILESEIIEETPTYLTLLSKIISLTMFVGFAFLVYFIIQKYNKGKNG